MSHLDLSLASVLANCVSSQLPFASILLLQGFLLAQRNYCVPLQFVLSSSVFLVVLARQQVDGEVFWELALGYLQAIRFPASIR